MKQEKQKNQRFTIVTTKRGCPDVIVHRGYDRNSCLKIAQSYADGVGEQKVIVYDSKGEVCYPWEALKKKPTATVTAREFIEYLEGMAATEGRDEERREADRDALWPLSEESKRTFPHSSLPAVKPPEEAARAGTRSGKGLL
jgi:hypothetical protein